MIFAGYEKPMEDFLRVNEGLSRRIPFRYTFEAYSLEQLLEIFTVMQKAKGETLASDVMDHIPEMLNALPAEMLETHNAGLINNWLSFAQVERDARIDIAEAEKNPELASLLILDDLELAMEKLEKMHKAGSSN